MEVPKEQKELMTRYLLGEATSVEQEELENRYAAEPEIFEELVAIENELADRYARGELSGDDQAAFESHVLAHPRRRARVDFADAFLAQHTKVSETEKVNAKITAEPAQWWHVLSQWRVAFAIISTACLLALSGWWLWRMWHIPRSNSLTANSGSIAKPEPTATTETSTITDLTATPTPILKNIPPTVALTLNANLMRGTEPQSLPLLEIPASTQIALLTLKSEASGYDRYRLTLQSSDGQTVRSVAAMASKGDFLIKVPARLLTNGEYALVLLGINQNGETDPLSKSAFGVRRTDAAP